MKATQIIEELKLLRNEGKAEVLQRFFKTGKGEYGEGDKFLGVAVPSIKQINKKFLDSYMKRKKLIEGFTVDDILNEVTVLLRDEYHEIRVSGCLIMIEIYSLDEEKVYNYYLSNTEHYNNWDLVDISCYKIIGKYLLNHPRNILYTLAQSKSLWERRISMVSTMQLIKNGEYKDAINICDMLKSNKEDLMHKACGWMLREIGKKNKKVLLNYLNKNITTLHSVTISYACEKLTPKEKEKYKKLSKKK